MKKISLLISLLLAFLSAESQKRPIDHDSYDQWESLSSFQITNDGSFAVYAVSPEKGDRKLYITNLKIYQTTILPRGSEAKVSADGNYVIYNINPEFVPDSDKKKQPAVKYSQDTLGIFNLRSGIIDKYPHVSKFKIAREANRFVAFFTSLPPDTTAKRKPSPKGQKKTGQPLMILDLQTKSVDTVEHVLDFTFNKSESRLYITNSTNSPDSLITKGFVVYDPVTRTQKTILNEPEWVSLTMPFISDDEKLLAFYLTIDSLKNDSPVKIYTYKSEQDSARLLVDDTTPGLIKDWKISRNRSLLFSRDNSSLFLGASPLLPKRDTTEEEIAKVDIWNYLDKDIQPKQLATLNQALRRSYLAVINVDSPVEIIQLAMPDYPIVRIVNDSVNKWGYALSDENYTLQSQWNADPKNDLYLISLKDGQKKLIQGGRYITNLEVSPRGNYLIWYDNEQRQWLSHHIPTGKTKTVSNGIKFPLWNELHDMPQMPPAYGNGPWMDDESAFFVYDKFDMWRVDPSGVDKPVNITNGDGRRSNITFRFINKNKLQLSPGTPGVTYDNLKPNDTLLFSAFDNSTKGYGYYLSILSEKPSDMEKLVLDDNFMYEYYNKAKDADIITFVKGSAIASPNLWVTKDWFRTATQITNTNPQQVSYNWLTVELVKWKGAKGKEIEGLLYKPENFDPKKKYPMLVYFYEKTSSYKNYYRSPAYSRSSINVPYFVSNGYLVFMPDIHYTVGYPGKSAMDCIIPGVKAVGKSPWVDMANLGIQGQSWGGYQTAFIITQTDLFEAACAGAPVSNMTSAYGGLRTGQGVSRQFQYEHTQSRIGKTLWDKGGLDLYIQNSPLFYVDRIKTPLLILSNDNDEAVPWYQGVELFSAMKRLNKPAWLLQYNNETHNISKIINARDFSIRLGQFFDHFLKGKPMPVWMTGLPATLKGIEPGFELIEDK